MGCKDGTFWIGQSTAFVIVGEGTGRVVLLCFSVGQDVSATVTGTGAVTFSVSNR